MARTGWAFGIAVLFMAVFFVDFCALVFQCGCRSLWNGISTYCNIHAAERAALSVVRASSYGGRRCLRRSSTGSVGSFLLA